MEYYSTVKSLHKLQVNTFTKRKEVCYHLKRKVSDYKVICITLAHFYKENLLKYMH